VSGRRFLLDTHAWVWLLDDPTQLPPAVRRQLQKPNTEFYLSPISIWEAAVLARRNRIKVRPSFAEWLAVALAKPEIREAPFTFAVASEASRITLPQPDPGDVFLAATALVYDLTLVTADRHLIDCDWLKTLAIE